MSATLRATSAPARLFITTGSQSRAVVSAPFHLQAPLRKMASSNIRQRVVTASAAANSAAADDVQGAMLEPSTANRPIVRFLALAATVAAAARSTGYLSAAGIGFVHLLAYGTWLGTLVWTTFIFGLVAFKNLPRQTFGRLQSKLFPIYFALSAACPAIILATLHFGSGGTAPIKEVYLLGIGLASSLFNLLLGEPAATRVMFKRYELENAPGPRDEGAVKALAKQFGKWHGISSLFNLFVLIVAIGHGYYLGAHVTLGA